MGTKIGLKCKLYRGTAGAKANVEMKNVRDVTLNLEKGEADVTTREADGWRMFVATIKEASVEFDMNYDPENEDFRAIFNAYLDDTPLAFFISDDEGNGLDLDCVVMNCPIAQPIEEAMKVTVTIKPTNIGGQNGRAPKWIWANATGNGNAE